MNTIGNFFHFFHTKLKTQKNEEKFTRCCSRDNSKFLLFESPIEKRITLDKITKIYFSQMIFFLVQVSEKTAESSDSTRSPKVPVQCSVVLSVSSDSRPAEAGLASTSGVRQSHLCPGTTDPQGWGIAKQGFCPHLLFISCNIKPTLAKIRVCNAVSYGALRHHHQTRFQCRFTVCQ
jgi:hypothetical protein